MSQHVTFLLLGLANGAVFAALGLALVVTHRSTKVLNFAVSAIALFTATIYSGLRRGELPLLLPGLPESLEFTALTLLPAAAAALLITAVLGLVLYLLVFRPLRTAPQVASAVASLGVSVVIVGLITERIGANPRPVDRIFAPGQFAIGDVTVTKDRVFVALTVVLVAVGISVVWRYTRFGLVSRAVSQSEKGAYVSGIPADRVAAANWMLSSVIAGVAGILIAPIVPPIPIDYSLYIVPALAVATLGGFERLAPAVIGGLALGMLQSEVAYLQVQHSWMPSSGAAELVPLALILVVLVARAKPLPSRGGLDVRRLGRAPRIRSLRSAVVGGTACASAALILTQHDKRAAVVTTLIFGLFALSQVVVTGFSGQISLAQLTLSGVAGFLLGTFTTDWGIPFPFAPLLASAAAMVIGVVFALPAVRIRGLPVAVVTLALAVALEAAWFRNTDLVSSSGKTTTGPELFGFDLSVGSGVVYPRLAFCFVVLALLVLTGVAVARLRTSRLGAAMLAVRANERAAAAAGINVVRTKIAAFAIGAFIAGTAGSMLAYKQGNVTVASFSVYLGLSLFGTSYLAGNTSVSGAMVAGALAVNGVVVVLVEDYLDLGSWYGVLAGVGLIYTVVRNPEGLVGHIHDRLSTLRRRRLPAAVPPSDDEDPEAVIGADRSAPGDVVLSIRRLCVRYGGVVAVSDVSFDVRAGGITGLIGPNGAGKTTLLDALTGFVAAEGDVAVKSTSLNGRRTDVRARLGLGRTFQSIELYDDLTVLENVAVGDAASAGSEDAGVDPIADALDVLGIAHLADRPVSELSHGTRQLVSIARALAGRPEVLLLDEPAAGLDSAESRWLGARLRRLRDRGMGILLVDHDLQLILDLCDDVQVLDFGELIAGGKPNEIRLNAAVRRAYMGSEDLSLDVADASSAPVADISVATS